MEAMNPTWVKVTAVLDREPDDWAYLVTVFEDHGITGTIQEEYPPRLSGYHHDQDAVPALAEALHQAGAVEVQEERIVEEDWAEAWKRFFVPRPLGNRFWIRPDWVEDAEVPAGKIELVLNPGQAFGTGDHPTTRLCIELLEEADLHGKSLAEIGCGSGILTLVAHKLGAKDMVAVDNDVPSIEATTENLGRHQVPAKILLGNGFAALEGAMFDVVVSNIISATLIRLAPEAAATVRPGGLWITSGIILANWPDVQAAAERNGFTLVEKREEGDWVGATFRH